MKTTLRILFSLVIGIVIGAFFHYVLYKISVSGEPFIYFAF